MLRLDQSLLLLLVTMVYKFMMMDGFILVGYLMLATHRPILNKHQLQAKSLIEMNLLEAVGPNHIHPTSGYQRLSKLLNLSQ